MRNVTPPEQRPPHVFRKLSLIAVIVAVALLCFLFPSMLAFVELAARELRYLWWLVLLAALGVYFFFFFGQKKD